MNYIISWQDSCRCSSLRLWFYLGFQSQKQNPYALNAVRTNGGFRSQTMIEFSIPGTPKPLKRHRVSKNGGMYDPCSKQKAETWLQIARFKPSEPYAGDIRLSLFFYMPRPKRHYSKSGAVLSVKYHSFRPDLDNLVKFIADVIQGKDRMIVDDSQICVLEAQKLYGKPRTEVIIEEIS